MIRSMYSGQTGLKNFQTQLDVIANNISNVNTVGFKASRITFQSMLYQMMRSSRAPQTNFGGLNPIQIGLGSKVASIDKMMRQGPFKSTGNKTDLFIQGDGFFILSDGIRNYYSRAGNFTLDPEGHFVNPSTGMKLQGWNAIITETGKRVIDSNQPIEDIQISPRLVMEAHETSFISFADNLKSDVGLKDSVINIKTSNGDVLPVKFTFERIMSKEYKDRIVYRWTAHVVDPDKKYEILAGSMMGEVELDSLGNVLRWTNYPGHYVEAYGDYNASYLDGSRIDSGLYNVDWPIRAFGNVELIDNTSGLEVSFDSSDDDDNSGAIDGNDRPDILVYRDSTDPKTVILQLTKGGSTYTFSVSTDGTIYDLNKKLAAGVEDSTGTYTLRNISFMAPNSDSIAFIPVPTTTPPDKAFRVEIYDNNNDLPEEWGEDGIYIYDGEGSIIPKYQDRGDEAKLKIASGSVKFIGKLALRDSDNNPVYYDPREILITTDGTGNVSIRVKVVQGNFENYVTFDLNANTVEDFNEAMTNGVQDSSGRYTISGLTIIEANPTDTFNANQSVTYYSIRKVLQTPVMGDLKLTDTTNSQNYIQPEYETPTVVISTKVYDSLGNPYDISVTFTKIAENTWYWKAETSDGTPLYKMKEDGTLTEDLADGVIAFDSNGRFLTSRWRLDDNGYVDSNDLDRNNGAYGFWFDPAKTGESPNPRVSPESTAGPGPVKVVLSFFDITQYSSPNSVRVKDQDGNAKGVLQDFSINEKGEIVGMFSNGLSEVIAQIAVARFTNPGGLQDVGNSLYTESDNSGKAKVGSFGEEGAGTLVSGALEMSNVDLSEEFTKLIVAQRGFQAVARVIITSDQILTELMAIKR